MQGKRDAQAAPGGIPHVADRTTAPLSFAQQRLWFAQQWDPESAAYNRPTALRLQGDLDVPSLERGLGEIVRRHEVLRTTFPAVDGQPVQRVGPMADLSLPVEDLTHLPAEERLAAAEQRMIDMLRQPFALESGPLFRVRLFRLDAADHLFFFLTHHIVFDGWSETCL